MSTCTPTARFEEATKDLEAARADLEAARARGDDLQRKLDKLTAEHAVRRCRLNTSG